MPLPAAMSHHTRKEQPEATVQEHRVQAIFTDSFLPLRLPPLHANCLKLVFSTVVLPQHGCHDFCLYLSMPRSTPTSATRFVTNSQPATSPRWHTTGHAFEARISLLVPLPDFVSCDCKAVDHVRRWKDVKREMAEVQTLLPAPCPLATPGCVFMTANVEYMCPLQVAPKFQLCDRTLSRQAKKISSSW